MHWRAEVIIQRLEACAVSVRAIGFEALIV